MFYVKSFFRLGKFKIKFLSTRICTFCVCFDFAQWQYRTQWGFTEGRLLLVENLTQYPALKSWNTLSKQFLKRFLWNLIIKKNHIFNEIKNKRLVLNWPVNGTCIHAVAGISLPWKLNPWWSGWKHNANFIGLKTLMD